MFEALKGRDYLTLKNFTSKEIMQLLDCSLEIKRKEKRNIRINLLNGKTLAMIFEKPSTRTRLSFEVGMYHLGGKAIYLNANDLQLSRGESIYDTAHVLSAFVDGILCRTFSQEKLSSLAKFSDVPVINGLSDSFHPTQALADLLTIYELKGNFNNLTLSYVGDGNNMANSLVIACLKMGININIISPKKYELAGDICEYGRFLARKNDLSFNCLNDLEEGIGKADFIYTDAWLSMGEEKQEEKKKDFKDYQINQAVLDLAKKDCLVMHCLPAHRGEEITQEVLEGDQSIVFHQAENRLHAHKGILASIL